MPTWEVPPEQVNSSLSCLALAASSICMDPIEDYQDVLQNIETVVAEVSRSHPELTNYTVARAYEAAISQYHAEARQVTPKPPNLMGLDATVYTNICQICEWRLGRTPGKGLSEVKPIPVEDLVACLRKLHKSVEFWTKRGGRQGYLKLIEKYV